MGVSDRDLARIQTFSGLNNRVKEPLRSPGTLREAENVDVLLDGKVRSRPGRSDVLVECSLGHSLWSDPEGLFPFGFYADGASLNMLNPDLTTALLRSDLSIGLDVSYARVNDSVFWCNGAECGMVDAVGDAAPWACENPAGQPRLEATSGALGAGQVQVCITFADRRGRESGATRAAVIDLDDGQGVILREIPQPNDPTETPTIRIYVTGGNDRALYHAKNIPAGTTMAAVLQRPEGRLLATQFLSPMPAGHIVRLWNGRQLVARGRYLLWSPALRYGLTHVGHMHYGMRDTLTMMEPIDGDGGGVFVSDGSRILFLAGDDPDKWVPKPVMAYGIQPGSVMRTPASAWGIQSKRWLPAWLGKDGLFAVGMPGGAVATFNQSEFVTGVGDKAASLFREADGLMQFITVARGSRGKLPLAVTDEAVARVYRHDETDV